MKKLLEIFNPTLVQKTSDDLDTEEVNSTEVNIAQVENQLLEAILNIEFMEMDGSDFEYGIFGIQFGKNSSGVIV